MTAGGNSAGLRELSGRQLTSLARLTAALVNAFVLSLGVLKVGGGAKGVWASVCGQWQSTVL